MLNELVYRMGDLVAQHGFSGTVSHVRGAGSERFSHLTAEAMYYLTMLAEKGVEEAVVLVEAL